MSTKENVLGFLEANRGQSVSGQHIAQNLNISRNAVWKAIKELEKEGHKIGAGTNKGYCLWADDDILSVQGMLPFLADKGCADKIALHGSLTSTNQTAKEMALAGAEHGTVVIADCQTAGRGRLGRGFYSPPGCGIYMSLILHPRELPLNPPTLITALAALTVCEAIEAVTKKDPRIKWVNDVYLDKKKICGILTEAVTDFESGGIEWVVVGIGINFSTPTAAFPQELRPIAGAIFPDLEPTATRNRLAAEIINRFLSLGNQYEKKVIYQKYRDRLMMLGERITVVEANSTYEAVAIDIDEDGRLLVENEKHETRILSSGEISIRM